MARPKQQTVLEAVGVELAGFGDVSPTLAASARSLARELDDPGTSATAKSLCARALRETLDRLRELAPPKKEADKLDELKERRAARRRNGGPAA